MHIHVAIFRWKPGTSEGDVEKAMDMIRGLQQKVDGIYRIVCTRNTSKYAEGYEYVVFVEGETAQAIQKYRSHPDHVIAAKDIERIEERGIGVDFVAS